MKAQGRGDGIFGGVEAQKKSGALHLHFFFFGQRPHQYDSLDTIAQRIRDGLCTAAEFKRFHENLCCERYPDEEAFLKEVDTIERQWPQFSERQEGADQWGDVKLGRIPSVGLSCLGSGLSC